MILFMASEMSFHTKTRKKNKE